MDGLLALTSTVVEPELTAASASIAAPQLLLKPTSQAAARQDFYMPPDLPSAAETKYSF